MNDMFLDIAIRARDMAKASIKRCPDCDEEIPAHAHPSRKYCRPCSGKRQRAREKEYKKTYQKTYQRKERRPKEEPKP